MISLSVNGTCCAGRPLDVLSQLVERRREVLGESARDAAVATAIETLSRLRTATREKRVGRKVKVRG